MEQYRNGLLMHAVCPGAECPGYTSKGDLHNVLVLLASLGAYEMPSAGNGYIIVSP